MSRQLNDIRIVFMGTPEFAVASLDALVKAGAQVVGVVTAPDKPAGRGMKLTESAVKKYAVEHGLPVLQPVKLKDAEFQEALRALRADLQVVVAFRMLPEAVWNMPPMGTLNVHGSLLPQYRGAAPINWAVINGEKVTGVTTFKLQQEIDTGHILLQDSFPIGDDDNAGIVHDYMKEVGAKLLVKTLEGLAAGTIDEKPQEAIIAGTADAGVSGAVATATNAGAQAVELKHAPKIFTETAKIDWNKSVYEIHNLIRGLSPYPGAFTYLQDKTLKIFRSAKEITPPSIPVGTADTNGKTYLKFACPDGYIHVLDLQLEGKKRMLIDDFLRGFRF
ncbi:methionyl-tRNA formyltransferase [Paraflavitalea pollutisoli]|uniref:methionyl-tRNA formyltransferase n=1 Tax=Paraflavitalea pollutisoli TaxID=3034143 RepID=UPI0023EAC70C|nr:methionyl-tRNA formyltransferase [Paraflavitalea sp. H1-2-19X]